MVFKYNRKKESFRHIFVIINKKNMLVRKFLTWASELLEKENSSLRLLLALVFLLCSVFYYIGQYATNFTTQIHDFQIAIEALEHENHQLELLIEKLTGDHYTKKEARIQIKNYDRTVNSLSNRISSLERQCFK